MNIGSCFFKQGVKTKTKTVGFKYSLRQKIVSKSLGGLVGNYLSPYWEIFKAVLSA